MLTIAVGCTRKPEASISDVRLYDVRDIERISEDLLTACQHDNAQACQKCAPGDNAKGSFGFTQGLLLKRFIHSNLLEVMLNEPQRRLGLYEAEERSSSLHGSIGLPNTQSSSTKSNVGNDPATRLARQIDSAGAAYGSVTDSPTDAIDRANEVYSAYFLKYLRAYRQEASDSSPRSLSTTDADRGDSSRSVWKTWFMAMEAFIDAGSEANVAVGVRAKVIAGTTDDSSPSHEFKGGDVQKYVKILRVTPKLLYDVQTDGTGFDRGASSSVGAGASLPNNTTVMASRQHDDFYTRRLQYLSRIPKVAGWIDATISEFGWTFYPTNFQVRPRAIFNPFDALDAAFVSGQSEPVYAYLDGGGRDCMAILQVRSNVTSLLLEIEQEVQKRPPAYLKEHSYVLETKRGTILVEFPRRDSALPPSVAVPARADEPESDSVGLSYHSD